MTDSLQLLTAALTAILDKLPLIITTVVTAYITIKQANKKTVETAEKTNLLVQGNTAATVETKELVQSTNATTVETKEIAAAVHKEVNGKNGLLQAKLDAALADNARLREERARGTP